MRFASVEEIVFHLTIANAMRAMEETNASMHTVMAF